MQALTQQRRDALQRTVAAYEGSLEGAAGYLASKRGLSIEEAGTYHLGYVSEPLDGHWGYKDRLVIPYMTPAGPVNVKYRCTQDHDCKETDSCKGKYLFEPGSQVSLYNVLSLRSDASNIVLTEGELDACIVEQRLGLPAVGYPGVLTWQSNRYWRHCFEGFETVWIIQDGDAAGKEAADKILKSLRNGVVIPMPEGHDSTTYIMEYGADAMLNKLGFNV